MPKVVPQYKDEAKRRIVLAAMEVMAESGHESVTIDAVARKIGVTKGAVYWYFPSKNALIQEIFVTMEKEIDAISSDPFFNRPDTLDVPLALDQIFLVEVNRRKIACDFGLIAGPDDSIPAMTPAFARELRSLLERGAECEQKNGCIASLSDTTTLALALALLTTGVLKGDIYATLFLGNSRVRRIWYYAMALFLNPTR
jgi:AcrR family transcriptional regulator